MGEHYLDNSATTRVLPEAAGDALRLMTESYGNPSSLHTLGFQAKKELDRAREIIARRLGALPEEIVFTGGGTEANNLAILGAARARKRIGQHIVTTQIEHDSVLNAMKQLETEGFRVTYLAPGPEGSIDPVELEEAIGPDTILVSMMLCNNETGAILPVQAAARAIKRKRAPTLLHTDCVQAFCKLDFTVKGLGVDLCTVSGHKVHGPKGVGALYVKKGARVLPIVYGGGQERGLRSGTESLPLIGAFAKAVELAPRASETLEKAGALRELLLKELAGLPGVEVNSPPDGLAYIVNLSVPDVRAETMLHFLAQRGVYVSAGSACGKAKPSHVLEAMGLSRERVASAIRVSFSRFSAEEDVYALIEGLRAGLSSLERER
jgi:cysteine desulfurase